MDSNDRKAIENLFGKLAEVEAKSQPRDPEAEAYIRDQLAAQPNSTYYMAQTIVVQDQALEAAQRRIAELETKTAQAPRGDNGQIDRGVSSPVPSISQPAASRREPTQAGTGGFLAGAAQTAMGVAGGVLLANMIGGLFRGDEAKAEETAQPQEQTEQPQDQAQEQAPEQEQADLEPATDDGGFDLGDFGGFDSFDI